MKKKKSPRAAKPVRARPPERLALAAQMTIVQAAALHGTLLARLASGPIVIDGSQVEEIDTAVLQLLASLWRSGAQRGIGCSWSGVSDVMRQSADLVGMTEMLHFPHDAA